MFPNELYIDSQWRPGSSGARFDVLNPADETVLASVASGRSRMRSRRSTPQAPPRLSGRARAPRARRGLAQGLRADDGAARGFLRGSSRSRTARRAPTLWARRSMPPSSSVGFRKRRCGPTGISATPAPRRRAHPRPSKAGGRRRTGDTVELSGGDGDPQDRAGARRRMLGDHQAGVGDAAHDVGADAAVGGGRRAAGGCQRASVATVGIAVDAMLHDPRVRVLSFTGSTQVGRKLLRSAGRYGVKPAMELGGNAPVIVFEDADLEVAVDGAMQAKMRNLGEACTAAKRFYVHEAVAEDFTLRYTRRMALLKMGNGLEAGIDVGPLVNAETRDKVAGFVEDAIAKGAELRLGGQRPNGPGFFYPPTVLFGVPDTANCLRDESFGPVAAIQTFTDEEDVIARSNDTEYGLVAYVFTGEHGPRSSGQRTT